MRKILLLCMVFFLSGTISCQKERLVIVEKELKLDENSPEYQVYLTERAMQFIQLFRFEKLKDLLDRIEDPDLTKDLQDSLRKYRSIAENEALYYVTEEKDTLYFLLPEANHPDKPEGFLGTNIATYREIINVPGIMHGFKNFPETKVLSFKNNLATGLKGVKDIPLLESFAWDLDKELIDRTFPDRDFEYMPFQVDFSQNSKLKSASVRNIQLGEITLPNHLIANLSSYYCFLPSGCLDEIKATTVEIHYGEIDSDFKITNSEIQNLTISTPLKALDISHSEVRTLYFDGVGILSEKVDVEKLILNEGLEELSLPGFHLKEGTNFPSSLKKLTLFYYYFNPDFSDLKQLEYLSFSLDGKVDINSIRFPSSLKTLGLSFGGSFPDGIDIDGLNLPSSLETFSLQGAIRADLDLSMLSNLKECSLKFGILNGETINFPSTIKKIDFQYAFGVNIQHLDLSHLEQLEYMNLGLLGGQNEAEVHPISLTLPLNLNEDAFSYYKEGDYKPVRLKAESVIVNKPAWFDQYVEYID